MTSERKPLPTDLIDELPAGYKKSDGLIGQNSLLKQLTKSLFERSLQPCGPASGEWPHPPRQ